MKCDEELEKEQRGERGDRGDRMRDEKVELFSFIKQQMEEKGMGREESIQEKSVFCSPQFKEF